MGLTTFTRAGLTFDVTDRGREDAEAVVLLHGFPADRHCWDEISDILVSQGLRTLAPDQRGYSPDARPTEGYPQAYAIQELVGDVVALLDAAGVERAHVVGHDWGGAVAWATAGLRPDRVAALTALSTPHPFALAPRLGDPWQLWHSRYIPFFQLPRVPEAVLRRRLVPKLVGWGLRLPVAERYAGRMREPGALTGALGWYRALRFATGAGRVPMNRITVPTTLVWGRRDAFLGRQAAEGTRRYVVADYELVELDEGHWLPELAASDCATHVLARHATLRRP